MTLFRKKIQIKVSKILIRTAMEDAAMYAMRREIECQTRQQVNKTWLEGCSITVEGCEIYFTPTKLPKIPDTDDLTFVWTD